MKSIKLDRNTNFIIWEKYHKVESSKNIIIQFIDSGILDVSPQLLKEKIEEFIAYCDDFYKTLTYRLLIVDETQALELLSYNIDFSNRTYIYEFNKNAQYDKITFSLNYLELKPVYKYMIQKLLEEGVV